MQYIFRDIVVFDYDPKTKQMTAPCTEVEQGNFNFCKFIKDDYKLIAEFFMRAFRHANDEITTDELEDIRVY